VVDVTKLSNIFVGMSVRIKVLDKNTIISGKVHKIYSKTDDPDGIIILSTSGVFGHVLSVDNFVDEVRARILKNEAHVSENKECFYEPIMRTHVIPATIQSFLNADGGYLYIGIYDAGTTPSEKFLGLDEDREYVRKKFVNMGKLQPSDTLSDNDFFDEFQSDIEKTLDKYLIADNPLGPLIDYSFPVIDNVAILQIQILPSPNPVFDNKPQEYQLYQNGQKVGTRTLDNFYYRDGSRKKPVENFQKFFKYLKDKSG
jgi:hypothetical protein